MKRRNLVPSSPVSLRQGLGLMMLWLSVLWGAPLAAQPPSGQLSRGLELFLHEWRPQDPRAAGDGLGPMHNENSCLKCHFLRSPGGGGRLEDNIQLISAIPNLEGENPEQRARDTLARLHPAFAVGAGEQRQVRRSIVLHRHDVNPGYEEFRAALLGRPPTNLPILEQGAVESHLRVLVNADQIAWIVSERNSPALFGNGIIDRLPESVFTSMAAKQTGQDNIRGRVPRTDRGEIGRFGWRGQSASLETFVATAFAVELGLSNSHVMQDPSPIASRPLPAADQEGAVIAPAVPNDISQRDIDDVTFFIASLPEPAQELPRQRADRRQAERGEVVFRSLGCAICHVKDVSVANGIFSDLLLHDMGEALADPVPGGSAVTASTNVIEGPAPIDPAGPDQGNPIPGVTLPPGARPNVAPNGSNPDSNPSNPNQNQPAPPAAGPPSGAGSYAGGAVNVLSPIDPVSLRLWRTPPLWGVNDSAPYLHDGRAGTLRRAIILHGGEGERSRNRFFGLSDRGQDDLIAFLRSLRAPQLIRQ